LGTEVGLSVQLEALLNALNLKSPMDFSPSGFLSFRNR
jgi:hypothetical protein